MPSIENENRALRILYILAVYIFLQVFVWGFMLIKLYLEFYQLWTKVTGDEFYMHRFWRKVWMIGGEGIVFLTLLMFGFWYVRRSISRELQLARMQNTFLLSVTHELKTPIASVRLFLDTIKSRKLSEEQTVGIINDALRETKRLQSLSENILITTSLDGKSKHDLSETINLSSLLGSEIARCEHIWKRTILKDIQNDLDVEGDIYLIHSMFSNLIENAVKYSPANTDILVSCKRESGEIFLKVKDFGIGIPDEEKDNVFGKFYRIGNEETRTHKGTGLGLYIVSSVVKLHGGRIFVSDNHPNGTVVTVVLNLNNSKITV